MRIYVASSWRNETQPAVVEHLRKCGHEVYDFRHPIAGNDGFSWKQVGLERDDQGKSTLAALKKAHAHPTAVAGFKLDFDAMKWADACVLVLPCGNSAHLEAGWMCGDGKRVFVYADGARKIEPELMYKIDDVAGLYDSLDDLVAALPPVDLSGKFKPGDKIRYDAPRGSYGVIVSRHTVGGSTGYYVEFNYGKDVNGTPITSLASLREIEIASVPSEEYDAFVACHAWSPEQHAVAEAAK
jgi:hypothetical protein